MRTRGAPDAVVGGADVGDPIADRLVHRVLQRPRAGVDAAHFRSEQLHPDDVRALPTDVLGPHVDDALQPEQRADRGGGDAVLPGAGLGDDPRLAHALGEQRLPERVVQLVRAGVEEVLPLEVDAGPQRERLRQAVGAKERSGPAGVRAQKARQLLAVTGVRTRGRPGALELVQRRDQRFRHEAAAICAESAAAVGGCDRLLREDRRHLLHLDAPRAARTNARTRSGSL